MHPDEEGDLTGLQTNGQGHFICFSSACTQPLCSLPPPHLDTVAVLLVGQILGHNPLVKRNIDPVIFLPTIFNGNKYRVRCKPLTTQPTILTIIDEVYLIHYFTSLPSP